jgi:hypothetical protein
MKVTSSAVALIAVLGISLFLVLRHANSQNEPLNANLPIRPVVVELFTSEGCSSCPSADALLAKLDREQRLGNAEIIALEEHVDYWDHLGWRDPFSSAQWTERQQDYAASFRNDGVYTPQMVVDGRAEFVGSSQSRARSAIAEAVREPKAEVTLSGRQTSNGKAQVSIAVKMLVAAESQKAHVWLAVTESGLHSNVSRGENAGEDLHHAAVVRSLRKVGDAALNQEAAYAGEQDVQLDARWKKENLRVVAFVQDAKTRHILGAASVRLMP